MISGFGKGSLLFTVAALAIATASAANGTTEVTTPDYARAARFLSWNTYPLIDRAVQSVTWWTGDRFWYIVHDRTGVHYRVMDATTGQVKPAFDEVALAAALASATGKAISAKDLDLRQFHYLPNGGLSVTWHAQPFTCSLQSPARSYRCAKTGPAIRQAGPRVHGALSPDGKLLAFVRDWNLWVRVVGSGKDVQLTFDGVKNYGYATQNAGWIHGSGLIVRWSPDSKKIATYRQDQRGIPDMYTMHTGVGHPRLDAWPYPLPGDQRVFMIEPVIIDVPTRRLVRLQMPPEQRLSTLCDKLACDEGENDTWSDAKWAPDSRTLALVSSSRDRQHEWFRVADAATGKVHTAFEFTARDYYESGRGRVNWQYLPAKHEAIWPSAQNGWLNLYLYDLKTGKQIRPITQGRGNVDEVLRVDRDTRTLWYVGNARTPGVNPYFKQFFKVDIDSGKTTLLTPENTNHTITLSPDGKYFLDCYSTVTKPPVTVLRASGDGHVIAMLNRTDVSRLQAIGWKPPSVFTVKARDGRTTLYGVMYKPTTFDPHRKYPVIDYIYPGPQLGSIKHFNFDAALSSHQALAELGFIVVAIDGMGTPWRSDSFHKKWYGDMADNTLPDQVSAIKQLAKRYPWIDASRVGIWGHSGGGFATADALLAYPGFFKVGWAESGNYDNRNEENDWGEKYQGLLVKHPDGTTNYDSQAMELRAKNLKGHLMLVHGSADDNVPIGSMYLLVNALIHANKDFDMLVIPNARHSYLSAEPYVTRRRWDYFVRYLMGATPPVEFKLGFPTLQGS